MNEWTIVTVMVTIVGLIITVSTPVIKLYSAITVLSSKVTQLLEDLKGLRETDQKLFGRVNDHETRISKLESKVEAYHEQGERLK